jgi:peptidyl-dipeptidase A
LWRGAFQRLAQGPCSDELSLWKLPASRRSSGAWLDNILKKGATEDWRKVLKEATGEDISTRAMMDYFKPLMSWLEEQNKGRQIGW